MEPISQNAHAMHDEVTMLQRWPWIRRGVQRRCSSCRYVFDQRPEPRRKSRMFIRIILSFLLDSPTERGSLDNYRRRTPWGRERIRSCALADFLRDLDSLPLPRLSLNRWNVAACSARRCWSWRSPRSYQIQVLPPIFEHALLIQFDFDQDVSASLSDSDLRLERFPVGTSEPELMVTQYRPALWDPVAHKAYFEVQLYSATPRVFLPTDRYRASIARENVTNSLGEELGSDAIIDIYFRKEGDADLDYDTDLDDVGVWSLNFTGELAKDPDTATKKFTQGDWDYDGDVDLDDVGLWSLNFTGELGVQQDPLGPANIGVTPFAGDPDGSLNVAWNDAVSGEAGWRIRWSHDGVNWAADDKFEYTRTGFKTV